MPPPPSAGFPVTIPAPSMSADATYQRQREQLKRQLVEEQAVEEQLAKQEQDPNADPVSRRMWVLVFAPKAANDRCSVDPKVNDMVMLCNLWDGPAEARVNRQCIPRIAARSLPPNFDDTPAVEQTATNFYSRIFTPESMIGVRCEVNCMTSLVRKPSSEPATASAIVIKQKEVYVAVTMSSMPTISPAFMQVRRGRRYAYEWCEHWLVAARRPPLFNETVQQLVTYLSTPKAAHRKANELLKELRTELEREAKNKGEGVGRADSPAQKGDGGEEKRAYE